jgi:hypothetical protein
VTGSKQTLREKARQREVRRRGVGRPERPVDPEDGPLPRFAEGLRQLRARAGYPTYRAMAMRAHFAPSVLSSAAAGTAFPTLRVTLAYVAACGASAAEWQHQWEATARELAGQPRKLPRHVALAYAREGD